MIATSASALVTVTPKVKTADQAVQTLADFAKNPPTTPQAFLSTMGKMFDVSGTIGAAVATAFPLVGSLVPVLGNIFGLFGGSSPSIGQVTLDAIQNLSKQLDDVKNQIVDSLSKKIDDSALKTINTVLAGVDETARQQSAALVFQNYIQQADLVQLQADKAKSYTQFLTDMQTARQTVYTDLQSKISQAQSDIDAAYNSVMAQVQAIAGDLIEPLLQGLQGYINQQTGTSASAGQAREVSLSSGAPTTTSGDMTPILLAAAGLSVILLLGKKRKK